MSCLSLNFLKQLLFLVTAVQAETPEKVFVLPGQVLSFTEVAEGGSVEACLNSGALTPMTSMVAPDRGVHTLTIVARDRAGNVSAPKFYRLVVDGQPPEVNVSWEPEPVVDEQGRAWLPPDGKLVIRSQDAGCGLETIRCQVNDRWQESADGTLEVVLPSAGSVAVTVSAVDRLGNRSAGYERTVAIDAQPPHGNIRISGVQATHEGVLIVAAPVGLSTVVDDTESGVAGWQPTLDGIAIEPPDWPDDLAAGLHVAECEVVDRVGNRAVLPSRRFQVDLVPPDIDWELDGHHVVNDKGVRHYSPPVTLRASAADAVFGSSELAYAWSGDDWQSWDGPLLLHQPSVQLLARDGVGNERRLTVRWYGDLQPPTIALRGGDRQDYPPGEPITISQREPLYPVVTDEQSGLLRADYRFHDLYYRALPEVFRFDKTGRFCLIIKAEDHLGNRIKVAWPVRVRRTGRGETRP